MKKTVVILLALSLSFAACKKTTDAGGSWTFLGNTYTVSNCRGVGNALVASSSTNSNISSFGNLGITFAGSSLPGTSGIYTVVDTTPMTNQVNVSLSTGGVVDTLYASTGAGSGQTVSVTVAKGVVSVSATNINMLNTTTGSGTAPVSFDIHTAGTR